MKNGIFPTPRRILIVSNHPLFGQGLRHLLQARSEADGEIVGIVSTVEEAMTAVDKIAATIVVLDYDDELVNRDDFLAHFLEGESYFRVVLLSLKEGGSDAIVYDRRTMAASQIDDWLQEWPSSDKPSVINP